MRTPKLVVLVLFVLLAILASFGLYGLSNASADSGWWECVPGSVNPDNPEEEATQSLCQGQVDKRMKAYNLDVCDWTSPDAYKCAIDSGVISYCTSQMAAFWTNGDKACYPQPTPTQTATSTSTPLPSATPTSTSTGTPEPTSTTTATPVVTVTSTPTATSTVMPPTVTPTTPAQRCDGGVYLDLNVFLSNNPQQPDLPELESWVYGNEFEQGRGWAASVNVNGTWSSIMELRHDNQAEWTNWIGGDSPIEFRVYTPSEASYEAVVVSTWLWNKPNNTYPDGKWLRWPLEHAELDDEYNPFRVCDDRLYAVGVQIVQK